MNQIVQQTLENILLQLNCAYRIVMRGEALHIYEVGLFYCSRDVGNAYSTGLADNEYISRDKVE